MTEEFTTEDSLTVNFDEQTGEIQLDWDQNDPRWSWMNDLTSEQVGAILNEFLSKRLDDLNEYETESPT